VRYATRTRSAGAFVRERLARLFVPFVVGLVLLVPPMFYLGRLGQPGFHESYWRFWLRFLDIPAMSVGILTHGSWSEFDPAHMWFLYVLLLFSITHLQSPRGARLVDRAAGFTERRGIVVLFGGAIPMAAVEAAFGPDVNTGGWERVVYLFPLLYGYVIASDPRFETAIRRSRRMALAGALVVTAVLVAWATALGDAVDIRDGGVPALSALQGLAGWLWIVSILGFAGSIIARRSTRSPTNADEPPAKPESRWRRAARYANEAVLPFYVLHEPVIVVAAWVIVRWDGPIVGKYLALVIVSFAVTLGLYEVLVRRFRVTRVLFGMKPAGG